MGLIPSENMVARLVGPHGPVNLWVLKSALNSCYFPLWGLIKAFYDSSRLRKRLKARCVFLPRYLCLGKTTPLAMLWGDTRHPSHHLSWGSTWGIWGWWDLWLNGVFSIWRRNTFNWSLRWLSDGRKNLPSLHQHDGRSSQGVLELSIFSSKLHILVTLLQTGQLSLSGSACYCFFLTWVYLTLSCLLRLKAESTRPNQKNWRITCRSLWLLYEEGAFCRKTGHQFGRVSGLIAHDLSRYSCPFKVLHKQNGSRINPKNASFPIIHSPSKLFTFHQLASYCDICSKGVTRSPSALLTSRACFPQSEWHSCCSLNYFYFDSWLQFKEGRPYLIDRFLKAKAGIETRGWIRGYEGHTEILVKLSAGWC